MTLRRRACDAYHQNFETFAEIALVLGDEPREDR